MKKCIPLDLTNMISRKFPGCFAYLDQCYDGNEDMMDKLCSEKFIDNISKCILKLMSPYEKFDFMYSSDSSMGDNISTIAATYPWRLYKQVYNFPIEMEECMYSQADNCKVPVDVLCNLPYPCIYIETSSLYQFDGFFFHFQSDGIISDKICSFLFVTDNLDVWEVPMQIIPNATIYDCMLYTQKEILSTVNKFNLERDIEFHNINNKSIINNKSFGVGKQSKFNIDCNISKKGLDSTFDVIKKALQLVLYICAQNKEISEDSITKKTYKKPKSNEYIKDTFREVQKWNLGTEMSRIIRKMNESSSVRYINLDEESKHIITSSKSPHVRRGHWHHYWTGKRGSEDRKCILKWVSPVFINADKELKEAPKITTNRA